MKLSTFLGYIMIDLGENCWTWTGSIFRSGYGQIDHSVAHRVAYKLFVGPIRKGCAFATIAIIKHA